MSPSRAEISDERLDLRLAELLSRAPSNAQTVSGLTPDRAVALFEDQVRSRALDLAARRMKQQGSGYYTIQSAGHEQNAVVAARLNPTDPAFLHYRSGAFFLARARQGASPAAVLDVALSLAASSDDPIAQGRHKVWGSRKLWIPPQTSTIASHVPKAVGTAFALGRARRLGLATELPRDAVVCCSFGDASLNHASALAGINAARWARRRGNEVPILFVCEDNGWGISVDTPRHWVEDSVAGLSHLRYLSADGWLEQIWEIIGRAIEHCREQGAPVFLHLPTLRLWGHAGSDVETSYRDRASIDADLERDPLLLNAERLVALGLASASQLRDVTLKARVEVEEAVQEAVLRDKLGTRRDVVAPLAPYDAAQVRVSASGTALVEARDLAFDGALPENAQAPSRRTLAAHINASLTDEMLRRPEVLVFGEDVGVKGGVYHVTANLQERFGSARVFDTLLDETTILGVAQGAALLGLLPVPEVQYLAYLHNALDQLRGEACSTQFFSNGQFQTPMVLRVASFGYQRGFGGHFHNDNAIGALRDIPGLMLAAPARGDDAARMLRAALACAAECGRVVGFLEPIALYHEKDLYQEGDASWLTDYPEPGSENASLLPGEVGIYGAEKRDLLIVSYANGLRLSLRAAHSLERDHGIQVRVLDLRWLAPLPFEALRRHAGACAAVLIVDECRATGGGVADAIIADLAESGVTGSAASVRSADSYVPLGPAANAVLIQESDIVAAARAAVRS